MTMKRVLALENNKYFRWIIVAAAILLPIVFCLEMQRQTNLITPLGGRYSLKIIISLLVAAAGCCLWATRVVGKEKMLRVLSWVSALIFPFMLYFCEEWLNFGSFADTVKFVLRNHHYMMLFMVAILTLIFWALTMIWRRVWITGTVMGVIVMIMAYINLTKMGINGEPFLPTDFYFAKNMGEITGFAGGAMPFTKELVMGVLILTGLVLLMFFGRAKTPKNPWLRIGSGVCCLGLVAVSIVLPKVKDTLFMAENIDMSRQFVQKTVYSTHGFMGGFLINIEGYSAPPSGYSDENIQKIISQYISDNEGTFEQPDVIVYLGESFFDVTTLPNVEFSKDPLPNLHRIQKEALSGHMLQASGVGGGTVRSEFEVLTGINLIDMKEGIIPYNTYVAKSTDLVNDLPNYFKTLGYQTTAMHSYKRDFYSRAACYGRMGFDTFIGEEDFGESAVRGDSVKEYILDTYLVDQVEKQLDKDDKNKFTFVISMENHGSFVEKYTDFETVATSKKWSQTDEAIANCYIKSASAADKALGNLYDYVMKREKPTVVLFFGDHMPTLGARHSVLANAGYISTGWSSDWTDEDKYNMYRTPFLIFSNFKNDKQDVGDYSDYMLPSLLLDYMNAPKNGYWNLISNLRENVRVYNRFITVDKNGEITTLDALDQKARDMIEQHSLVSYDALIGKRYINKLLLKDLGE